MVYSYVGRIIAAGLMPVYRKLKLEVEKELASDYFLERRGWDVSMQVMIKYKNGKDTCIE